MYQLAMRVTKRLEGSEYEELYRKSLKQQNSGLQFFYALLRDPG